MTLLGLESLEAQEYVEINALGAALAALMDWASVGDPLELRVDMLKEIAERAGDDAKKFLLFNVVESYFRLTDEDSVRFRELLRGDGLEEVGEMEMTWADEMMEKGRIDAMRSILVRQIEAKFGPVSEQVRSRIASLEAREELDAYLERVLTASSMEEMGFG